MDKTSLRQWKYVLLNDVKLHLYRLGDELETELGLTGMIDEVLQAIHFEELELLRQLDLKEGDDMPLEQKLEEP